MIDFASGILRRFESISASEKVNRHQRQFYQERVNIMDRRFFLKGTSLAGVSLGALATGGVKAMAQSTEPQVSVTNVIGTNHGHALTLTLVDVILGAQDAQGTGMVAFDIQGKSGHPHTLELTSEDFVTLIVEGSLEKESSIDFGHPHTVTVTLTVE